MGSEARGVREVEEAGVERRAAIRQQSSWGDPSPPRGETHTSGWVFPPSRSDRTTLRKPLPGTKGPSLAALRSSPPPLASLPQPSLEHLRLPGLDLLEEIGRGAHSVVYRARPTRTAAGQPGDLT